MKAKNNLSLALLTVFTSSPIVLNATPLAPEDKSVADIFTVDIQNNFELYADSEDDNLIWYVPAGGSIAMLGSSSNPVPRFNASSFVEFNGVFAGQAVALMGGSFSTAGFAPLREQLEQEAAAAGYTVSPAQASSATTKFIVSGMETSGQVNADCDVTELTVTNPITGVSQIVRLPNCTVTYDDGTVYDVDTIQRFTALTPAGQTSVSTSIPFQVKTTPAYALTVANNLAVGANFDDVLSAVVDWEIPTTSITRTARLTIDYRSVFEKATTFSAIHDWACVDVEIATFFQRLVRDGDGITVEYLNDDNQWVLDAPNDADFIGVINEVEEELRDEIFAEMQSYTEPNLPNVSRETNSFFTLRANYEKLIFEANETRIINYNPGNAIKTARTDMFLGCLTGGFGTPVVASSASNCKTLFGIE